MYSPEKLIREIENICSIFFLESTFNLTQSGNTWKIGGTYLNKAVNYYKNDSTQVNVIKWFDDFWFYMSISFKLVDDEFPNTFISISIFQGNDGDERKNQLFRAEWDNYENNEHHPQPHWHFYPIKYHHQLYDEFETFLTESEPESSFENQISQENFQIVDLRKMHFAMNADWSLNGSHIHLINEEEVIVNWLRGLLNHMKTQLEFLN